MNNLLFGLFLEKKNKHTDNKGLRNGATKLCVMFQDQPIKLSNYMITSGTKGYIASRVK